MEPTVRAAFAWILVTLKVYFSFQRLQSLWIRELYRDYDQWASIGVEQDAEAGIDEQDDMDLPDDLELDGDGKMDDGDTNMEDHQDDGIEDTDKPHQEDFPAEDINGEDDTGENIQDVNFSLATNYLFLSPSVSFLYFMYWKFWHLQ